MIMPKSSRVTVLFTKYRYSYVGLVFGDGFFTGRMVVIN